MAYGALIGDAFRIAWRNRSLWFFGLFAAGGSYGFGWNSNPSTGGRGAGFRAGASEALDPGVVVAIIVGGVLLIAVLVVLSVISHGGLADSVAAIDRGERRGFRATWRAGGSRFWRVLGLGVLLVLLGIAVALAVVLPLGGLIAVAFLLTDSVAFQAIAVILVILLGLAALVFVLIPFTVMAQFALRELVLGGARVTAAIGGGFRLLRRTFWRSFLVFLIDLGIALGVSLVLGLVLVLLLLPFLLLLFAGSDATLLVGIVTGVIVVPLLLIASGAIGTFRHAYWTLAYLRIEPRQPAG
jgi:hypothetical protein